MDEPGRTRTVAEWWGGLSRGGRTNVGMYVLAGLALVALVVQIQVGDGTSPQRVEVASRAPAEVPSPPRLPTTAAAPSTLPFVLPPVTEAPGATAPGPTTTAPPPAGSSVDVPAPTEATTVTLPCRNSTHPECGSFFWDPARGPNQPMTLSVTPSTTTPAVGVQMTFTVRVVDPDHAVTQNCAEIDYGDGEVYRPPCNKVSCPDPHGAWTPPPAVAGDETYSFTHIYSAPGPVTASFTFHTDFDPPCPGAYGSAGSRGTNLSVQPAP